MLKLEWGSEDGSKSGDGGALLERRYQPASVFRPRFPNHERKVIPLKR